MKTVTVTFNIDKETLLKTFKSVGKDFDLKLKKDLNFDELVKEFGEDVSNYIEGQLEEFIEEGLNQDCYLDFFDED